MAMNKEVWEAVQELKDGKRLRILDRMYGDKLYEAHARAQARLRENRIIEHCRATGQKVALVWSGMDCDCVRYSGSVGLHEPNRKAIDASIEHEYEWADGPCGYYMCTEEEARKVERTSRDLALEAFEDGHPHVVYY